MTNKGQGFAEQVAIHDGDAAREHLLMNLRLREGLDLAAYELRWGMRPPPDKLTAMAAHGLLALDGDTLTATPRGRLVLNALIAEILN